MTHWPTVLWLCSVLNAESSNSNVSVIPVNLCFIFTHAGCIAAGVGRAFSRVCLFVCLFVCPRSKRKKQLYLSTSNLVLIYSIVVARHALSKGQGHTVTKTVTVARLLVTRADTAVCCCCRRGSACRYDWLCFLVFIAINRVGLDLERNSFAVLSFILVIPPLVWLPSNKHDDEDDVCKAKFLCAAKIVA